MFKNIKLLRKLKQDSYNVEMSEDDYINESNEAVIYVNSKNINDIICKYSIGDDVIINDELAEYLQGSVDYIEYEHGLNIKINSEKEFTREEKDKTKLSIRNYFTKKVADINEKLYSNKIESFILMLVTLFVLSGYVLLNLYFPIEILSEIVLIAGWVFAWRFIESLAFERNKMRKAAIKYYRILNARIEFLT